MVSIGGSPITVAQKISSEFYLNGKIKGISSYQNSAPFDIYSTDDAIIVDNAFGSNDFIRYQTLQPYATVDDIYEVQVEGTDLVATGPYNNTNQFTGLSYTATPLNVSIGNNLISGFSSSLMYLDNSDPIFPDANFLFFKNYFYYRSAGGDRTARIRHDGIVYDPSAQSLLIKAPGVVAYDNPTAAGFKLILYNNSVLAGNELDATTGLVLPGYPGLTINAANVYPYKISNSALVNRNICLQLTRADDATDTVVSDINVEIAQEPISNNFIIGSKIYFRNDLVDGAYYLQMVVPDGSVQNGSFITVSSVSKGISKTIQKTAGNDIVFNFDQTEQNDLFGANDVVITASDDAGGTVNPASYGPVALSAVFGTMPTINAADIIQHQGLNGDYVEVQNIADPNLKLFVIVSDMTDPVNKFKFRGVSQASNLIAISRDNASFTGFNVQNDSTYTGPDRQYSFDFYDVYGRKIVSKTFTFDDTRPTVTSAMQVYDAGSTPINKLYVDPFAGSGQDLFFKTAVTDAYGIVNVELQVSYDPTFATYDTYTMVNTIGDNYEYTLNAASRTWTPGVLYYRVAATDGNGNIKYEVNSIDMPMSATSSFFASIDPNTITQGANTPVQIPVRIGDGGANSVLIEVRDSKGAVIWSDYHTNVTVGDYNYVWNVDPSVVEGQYTIKVIVDGVENAADFTAERFVFVKKSTSNVDKGLSIFGGFLGIFGSCNSQASLDRLRNTPANLARGRHKMFSKMTAINFNNDYQKPVDYFADYQWLNYSFAALDGIRIVREKSYDKYFN